MLPFWWKKRKKSSNFSCLEKHEMWPLWGGRYYLLFNILEWLHFIHVSLFYILCKIISSVGFRIGAWPTTKGTSQALICCGWLNSYHPDWQLNIPHRGGTKLVVSVLPKLQQQKCFLTVIGTWYPSSCFNIQARAAAALIGSRASVLMFHIKSWSTAGVTHSLTLPFVFVEWKQLPLAWLPKLCPCICSLPQSCLSIFIGSDASVGY